MVCMYTDEFVGKPHWRTSHIGGQFWTAEMIILFLFLLGVGAAVANHHGPVPTPLFDICNREWNNHTFAQGEETEEEEEDHSNGTVFYECSCDRGYVRCSPVTRLCCLYDQERVDKSPEAASAKMLVSKVSPGDGSGEDGGLYLLHLPMGQRHYPFILWHFQSKDSIGDEDWASCDPRHICLSCRCNSGGMIYCRYRGISSFPYCGEPFNHPSRPRGRVILHRCTSARCFPAYVQHVHKRIRYATLPKLAKLQALAWSQSPSATLHNQGSKGSKTFNLFNLFGSWLFMVVMNICNE